MDREVRMKVKDRKMKRKANLPQVIIQNKGRVTRVFVDGEELNGVRSIEFLHDSQNNGFPIVKIGLLADQICLETAQVFALPDVYHPFYVSSSKLVELGILTEDKLNELLLKGLL